MAATASRVSTCSANSGVNKLPMPNPVTAASAPSTAEPKAIVRKDFESVFIVTAGTVISEMSSTMPMTRMASTMVTAVRAAMR